MAVKRKTKKKQSPKPKIAAPKKGCPFCGGKGRVNATPWGTFVECKKCNSCGPNQYGAKSAAKAVDLWDTRK